MVTVQPIEALTIVPSASHWFHNKVSPKKIKPENAAIAGSRLIKVPKLKAVKFLSAIISRVKGSALANIARAKKYIRLIGSKV